jgi:hypothetical protein
VKTLKLTLCGAIVKQNGGAKFMLRRVFIESVALIRGFDENREKQKGDAQNEHTENDRPCELE